MSVTSHRSAEEIGRTELDRGSCRRSGTQTRRRVVSRTVLANGLRVLAAQTDRAHGLLRLTILFRGTTPHSATAEVLAETLLTGTRRRDCVHRHRSRPHRGELARWSIRALEISALPTSRRNCWTCWPTCSEASYVDNEVRREADRISERIAVARTQPKVIAREALQRRRYGDHPYTREVPKAEDVAAVVPEAVRSLHAASVVPNGATLVLVGDVDPDTMVAEIERALGAWSSDARARKLPELPDLVPGDVLLVARPGAVQSQIRLSAQAVPRTDPRYPALQLANLAYGGYFSSRLVENIREDKGYTYGAHSGFEFVGSKATVQVEADTASEVTAAALLETRYELGRLGLVPPTDAEVDSVRQYAIGTLLIASSSQSGLANQLSALAELGLGAEWLSEHPARLAQVTTEQVAEAALEFFAPNRFTGVVVGDAEALAPKLLALGGVTVDDGIGAV